MEYSGYVRCDGGEVGLFRQLFLPMGCAEDRMRSARAAVILPEAADVRSVLDRRKADVQRNLLS